MKSLSKEYHVDKRKLFKVSDTGKILGPDYEEEAAQEMENGGATKKQKPKYFGGAPSKGMVKIGMMHR